MTLAVSLEADLTIRGPGGRAGRVVGSGRRMEVTLPWRLLLALLRRPGLRRLSLASWRALESGGVEVAVRLPGLPAIRPGRLPFLSSTPG